MINVLVTGGTGQLAAAIKSISGPYANSIAFTFRSSEDLDITDHNLVMKEIETWQYDYCINCAAYTQVDKAETERDRAIAINATGPKNLAIACTKANTVLIHISTDFVFSGSQSHPYKEEDSTGPLGIYGRSKLDGEREIATHLSHYFIIRTSWLYSEFCHNFMMSMIRMAKDKNSLSIVYDQVGTPTYARDLAEMLITLILSGNKDYGLYHFSNEGVASWYDFAKAIFTEMRTDITIMPIRSEEYVLPAKRPSYSVMDKEKVKKHLQIQIPYWRDSLKRAIENYKNIV